MSSTSPTPDDDPFIDALRESLDQQPIPIRPSNQQTMDALMAKRPTAETPHTTITIAPSTLWSRVFASVPVIAIGVLLAIVIWRIDVTENSNTTNDDTITSESTQEVLDTTLAQQNPKTTVPTDAPQKEELADREAKPKPAKDAAKSVRYGLKEFKAEAAATKLKALLNDHDATVTADQRTNSVTIIGTEGARRIAKQYIAELHRANKNQQEADEFPPRILSAIRYCNQCIENRRANPQKLALYFGSFDSSNTPEKQASLAKGFAAMGIPKSVRGVQQDVSEDRKWLTSSDSHAFTYSMNYDHLWSDVESFADTVMGDRITQDMLDGIRDDPEGPRIDTRKVAKSFKDEFVLILHALGSPEQVETIMLAIPLTDPPLVARAVDRAMAIEPDTSKTSVNGVGIYVIQHKGYAAHAICIANDHLIIGDPRMVIASIDRL